MTAATVVSSSLKRRLFFSTQLSYSSLALPCPCLWPKRLSFSSLDCRTASVHVSLSSRSAGTWAGSVGQEGCRSPTARLPLQYTCLWCPQTSVPRQPSCAQPLQLKPLSGSQGLVGSPESVGLPCPFLLNQAECREVLHLALLPSLWAEGWQNPSWKLSATLLACSVPVGQQGSSSVCSDEEMLWWSWLSKRHHQKKKKEKKRK